MSNLLDLWKSEPALVVGFVTAVLDLGIAFGLPVTPDQKIAIVGVVSAALAMLGATFVRGEVTPVSSLPATPPNPPAGQ